jgi:hypothetical protein
LATSTSTKTSATKRISSRRTSIVPDVTWCLSRALILMRSWQHTASPTATLFSSWTSHVMSSQWVSEFSKPTATTIVPTWTGCPPLPTSPALALPVPPLLVGLSPQPLLILSALALPAPLLLIGPSPQANPFSHLRLVSRPTKLEAVATMMAAGLAKDWNQRRVAVSCKLVITTVSQTRFSWGASWVAALPARAEFCQ